MRHEEILRETCKKLEPVIGERAKALWVAYLTSETPAMKMEAESMINLFATHYLPGQPLGKSILLPPTWDGKQSGDYFLGNVLYNGQPLQKLYLDRENLMKHTGIFSITGAGKTTITLNLLSQMLDDGLPFFVIDWKRSYKQLANHPKAKERGFKVFTVGRNGENAFNWNPLRPPPGVHPQTWIGIVAETLEKSHLAGLGVSDILSDVLDKQFASHGFYDENASPEVYPNFYDAKEEVTKRKFQGRRGLWQDSCERILRSFTFGQAAESFNARNPVKLEELFTQPVVFELDMELPKPLRVFFSEMILRWMHVWRLRQGESDTLRHVLILEEVHNLFPKGYIEQQATNTLENVVRELRSFGQGVVFISQHPSLIPVFILGNCNTLIYLSLQHEQDIRTARESLFLSQEDSHYLDRLQVGEGIAKIKGKVTPVHVRFPPYYSQGA